MKAYSRTPSLPARSRLFTPTHLSAEGARVPYVQTSDLNSMHHPQEYQEDKKTAVNVEKGWRHQQEPVDCELARLSRIQEIGVNAKEREKENI